MAEGRGRLGKRGQRDADTNRVGMTAARKRAFEAAQRARVREARARAREGPVRSRAMQALPQAARQRGNLPREFEVGERGYDEVR